MEKKEKQPQDCIVYHTKNNGVLFVSSLMDMICVLERETLVLLQTKRLINALTTNYLETKRDKLDMEKVKEFKEYLEKL